MEAAADYLNNGEADLALIYGEMVEEGQDFTPLFGAPPYAMLPVDDPLARGDSVCLADLADNPMIMLDLPRTKTYFVNMFESFGLKPKLVHSTRSAEIVRALVSGGHGYSILNIIPLNYSGDDARIRILPIRDKIHVPIFGIMTLAGTRQPPIVRAFIDQCIELKDAGVFEKITI